jgi:hypothetical protein
MKISKILAKLLVKFTEKRTKFFEEFLNYFSFKPEIMGRVKIQNVLCNEPREAQILSFSLSLSYSVSRVS